MDIQALKNELTSDPLTRGYAGMSDQEAADDLNAVYRTRQDERIDQADVYNSVDASEFQALAAGEKQEVWDIVHVGGALGLWVRPGDLARDRFITIFGAGSQTITDLQALITHDISRADELGLGKVSASDVGEARAA